MFLPRCSRLIVLVTLGVVACTAPLPERLTDPTRRDWPTSASLPQPVPDMSPAAASDKPASPPDAAEPSVPNVPSAPNAKPAPPEATQPASPAPTAARVIRVGAKETTRTIADAARLARDGDTVEIEAGDYRGDVAVWTQRNIIIRGARGFARLDADGKAAEGKAIFVIRGENVTVENIEFLNCKVSDRNGAGIRLESGSLTIENSIFSGNENGILTGNNENMSVRITNSTFTGNGSGDGYSHNLYIGRIRRFEVEGSYFARANGGHLLKSRARENHVRYNRLTDESTGRASYELEFPNGGIAYVVGNLIEQSPNSQNDVIVSFGAEGLTWPNQSLVMAHNTIVNNKTTAPQVLFVRVAGDAPTQLTNNLFVGAGQVRLGPKGEERGNRTVALAEFSGPAQYDFRVRAASRVAAPLQAAGSANGVSLNPSREYVHPRSTRATAYRATPGAFQIPGP